MDRFHALITMWEDIADRSDVTTCFVVKYQGAWTALFGLPEAVAQSPFMAPSVRPRFDTIDLAVEDLVRRLLSRQDRDDLKERYEGLPPADRASRAED